MWWVTELLGVNAELRRHLIILQTIKTTKDAYCFIMYASEHFRAAYAIYTSCCRQVPCAAADVAQGNRDRPRGRKGGEAHNCRYVASAVRVIAAPAATPAMQATRAHHLHHSFCPLL